ncbi:MAG: ABC transporter ATP-binding protein [Neisseriaceae bacterium]|nr:ABC transporter ATP-binding protein [Neisseriaceae bacterium]
MDPRPAYFAPILTLLEFEDYAHLSKRLIDLTLDTDDLVEYQRTVDLLDWRDTVPDDHADIKTRLTERLNQLMTALSAQAMPAAPALLISAQAIRHDYGQAQHRFQLGPISFDLHAGQVAGLVGENGNGKTTLLRLLCGALKLSDGTLTHHIPHQDRYDLRSKLIYIPQRTPTWKGSLLDNLTYTASLFGCKGLKNTLFVALIVARMGLRPYRQHRWADLSSGYKMRFELARALLSQPQLLFIDEPLANLDILAQQTVLDDFKDITHSPFRPMALMLSSQQLYEVERTADFVLFLKRGQMDHNTQHADPEAPQPFIVELDSAWSQDQLQAAFAMLELTHIQKNGGTYVCQFPTHIDSYAFLQQLIQERIPVTSYRDISHSTRRFFLNA